MRQAIASRTVIDEVAIRQIALSNAGQYFDHNSVIGETRQVLTFQSLRVMEQFTVGGSDFDFALSTRTVRPRCLSKSPRLSSKMTRLTTPI